MSMVKSLKNLCMDFLSKSCNRRYFEDDEDRDFYKLSLPSRQILVLRMLRECPPPTSPKDTIWPSGDVPNWRPGDVLMWRPRNVSGRLIRDVPRTFLRRPLDDLENTSKGRCGVICWMSLNFCLLFYQNLFDWAIVSKSNLMLKVYLGFFLQN